MSLPEGGDFLIFRSINAYPSNSTDIDALEENIFFTTIQGSSSIVSAYTATIYNAVTFDQVYTTNKTTILSPLTAGETLNITVPTSSGMVNGNAYYWMLRLYQSSPDIFITNTVVQTGSTTTDIVIRQHNNIKVGMYIKIGNEQRQISSYTLNSENNAGTAVVSSAFSSAPSSGTQAVITSDFVDSLQFPFYAKTTPTLSIPNIPSTLTNRTFEFVISYYQEQGVPIKWYRLILRDSQNAIVQDTGKIYSSLLKYTFSGFADGETYTIIASAENSDGISVESPTYTMQVVYPSPNLELPPQIEQIIKDNALKITWTEDLFSNGTSTGTYHFESDKPFTGATSLSVDTGIVYYDSLSGTPLQLDESNFTVFTDVTIDQSKTGKIIELVGSTGNLYYIFIQNNRVYSFLNGVQTSLATILEYEASGQQPTNVAQENYSYVWKDDEVWNDDYYWVETLPYTRRFKIVMMPTQSIATEVS